jgi:hypothetical protein
MHQRVRKGIFPDEMKFAPKAVDLAAAIFVKHQAAERFIFTVEHEEAALCVAGDDIRKHDRRGK